MLVLVTVGAGKPAIAQLVEHLTVELCSYLMVPGSIPGGRICTDLSFGFKSPSPGWTVFDENTLQEGFI